LTYPEASVTAPDTKTGHPWGNTDNTAFYEAISVDTLQQFAEKAGLSTGCDLDLLKPYWSKAQSILEVGAGYGRVIDYLMKHHFTGQITAIERCNVFFNHLQKQFFEYPNVELVHGDIMQVDLPQKFDLILVLWSGIADFSHQEQSAFVLKLANFLKTGGDFIIDTMPQKVLPLMCTEQRGDQTFLTMVNNKIVCTYEPSAQEILHYAQLADLNYQNLINLTTTTRRERWLHALR